MLQITSNNALKGTLGGNSQPFEGKSALHFMAKEPRFSRRGLADHILRSIQNFPENDNPLVRNVSLMPSFYAGTHYVFLQLKAIGHAKNQDEHREIRQAMLEIACAAAKLKFPDFQRVIGIATDAPKYAGTTNSEDMLLMEFEDWSPARQTYYEEANRELRFFATPQMQMTKKTISEFPRSPKRDTKLPKRAKVGRNERCPCGSGIKFKKCCGK